MLDRVLISFLALSTICTINAVSAVKPNVTIDSSPEPPNVAEGDSITLCCNSTNGSVQTHWLLNGKSAASEAASLGLTITGNGANASCLTVPGLMAFNDATVKCVAFIYATGGGTVELSPNPVRLRIQGRLESVNLSKAESNDSCCYHFNWSPPFTLPGVPILGYSISVTNNTNGAIILTDTGTATKWEYCPKEFGDYTVSVAAVNTVGEGYIDTVEVKTEEPHVEAHVIKQYLEDEEWKLLVEINTSQSHKCVSTVSLESDADNISINANNLSDIDGRLVANFIIPNNNMDDLKKYFTVSLSYPNDLKSKSSSIVISFFDVVDYFMSIDGDKINIRCIFAPGSRAKGCFIKIKEVLSTREYKLNITLVDISGSIQLVPARRYYLLVYDINSDSSIPSSPAFTEQFGMPPVRNSTNPLPEPTLGHKPHSSTIIIGCVCGTIALIVLIVAIITIIIAKQCRKKCKKESCLPTYDEPQRDRNVYTHRNGTNNLPVHGHSCRSTMQQKLQELQWFKMLVDRLQRRS